jgi:hypothetical protein
MEFEVGNRVVHNSNERCGFIYSIEKRRVLMVEIRWEDTGIKQWLPAEELRLWNKAKTPPPKPVTPWGRTTPDYLVQMRYKLSHDPAVLAERKERWAKKKKEEQLAKDLDRLSEKRKTRSRKKAKRLISKFKNK